MKANRKHRRHWSFKRPRSYCRLVALLILTLVVTGDAAIPQASCQTSGATFRPVPGAGASATTLASQPSLADRVQFLLSDPESARGFWGVKVVDAATGQTLYSYNAEKLFAPASNAKLFTTTAALALLGAKYKIRTTVESSAPIDALGRLHSDMMLVGRGDANLSSRVLPYRLKTARTMPLTKVFDELADELVRNGLKKVEGNLIADDSYFAYERYGDGWAQDDLLWEYGAPVSALAINDNVIFITVLPGARVGAPALINVNPPVSYYSISNRVITSAANAATRDISMNREPGSHQLQIWGQIPVGDPGMKEEIAVEDPAEFAGILFRGVLQQHGVTLTGKILAQHRELQTLTKPLATTAKSAASTGPQLLALPDPKTERTYAAVDEDRSLHVLASHLSLSLMEDVRVINKVSQNLHVEMLLRLLGRQAPMTATVEQGLNAVRGFIARAGIPPDEVILFDGSGLSRRDLVTPNAIVNLLQYAALQPWGAVLKDSLPVGGLDGTLTSRLKSSLTRGRVFAKTGTLSHVSSLSGYATTTEGRSVIFSVLSNNHSFHSQNSTDVIDQIVEAIVDDRNYARP